MSSSKWEITLSAMESFKIFEKLKKEQDLGRKVSEGPLCRIRFRMGVRQAYPPVLFISFSSKTNAFSFPGGL